MEKKTFMEKKNSKSVKEKKKTDSLQPHGL